MPCCLSLLTLFLSTELGSYFPACVLCIFVSSDWNVVLRPFSTSKSCPASSVCSSTKLCAPLQLPLSFSVRVCSVVSDSLRTPATPPFPRWTVHQALLSTEFYRQEYCSGIAIASPGDLLTQGLNPCLASPTVAGGFFTPCTTWEVLIFPEAYIQNHLFIL